MGFQCLRFPTATLNGFEKSMGLNQSGRLSMVNNMKLDFLRDFSDPLSGAKKIFSATNPNAGGFRLGGLVSTQKFRRLLGISSDSLCCQRWTEQVSWCTHENVCATALPAFFLRRKNCKKIDDKKMLAEAIHPYAMSRNKTFASLSIHVENVVISVNKTTLVPRVHFLSVSTVI